MSNTYMETRLHTGKHDNISRNREVLSEKVFLSVEELLVLLLEVRKYFKEATTTKHLLALPAAGANTVLTFSVRVNCNLS